jgi:hypothetical protein
MFLLWLSRPEPFMTDPTTQTKSTIEPFFALSRIFDANARAPWLASRQTVDHPDPMEGLRLLLDKAQSEQYNAIQ